MHNKYGFIFLRIRKTFYYKTKKERETDGREKKALGTGNGTGQWNFEAGTYMGSPFFLQTG